LILEGWNTLCGGKVIGPNRREDVVRVGEVKGVILEDQFDCMARETTELVLKELDRLIPIDF